MPLQANQLIIALAIVGCGGPRPMPVTAPTNHAIEYALTIDAHAACIPWQTAAKDRPDLALCHMADGVVARCHFGHGMGSQCTAIADLRPKKPDPEPTKTPDPLPSKDAPTTPSKPTSTKK